MKSSANPRKKSNLILGIILIFMGICCAFLTKIFSPQPAPKFGKEFNSERIKRGIPVIPENWDYFSYYPNRITWENPIWDSDTRYYGDGIEPLRIYYQKVVTIKTEHILEETDVYMGGGLRIGDDGEMVYERVLITCAYYLDTVENVTCTADVYTQDVTFINGSVNTAKDILKKWGLSYP